MEENLSPQEFTANYPVPAKKPKRWGCNDCGTFYATKAEIKDGCKDYTVPVTRARGSERGNGWQGYVA